MGRLLNIVTPLHTATKRDYMGRMNDDKIGCSLKAREYEADYWDGDRRFGYGGYRFIEGRWAPVAKALIGLRSAVVIRTPAGEVQSRRIPAGSLKMIGDQRTG